MGWTQTDSRHKTDSHHMKLDSEIRRKLICKSLASSSSTSQTWKRYILGIWDRYRGREGLRERLHRGGPGSGRESDERYREIDSDRARETRIEREREREREREHNSHGIVTVGKPTGTDWLRFIVTQKTDSRHSSHFDSTDRRQMPLARTVFKPRGPILIYSRLIQATQLIHAAAH